MKAPLSASQSVNQNHFFLKTADRIFMKFHINFWFLKDKKVIQLEKIIIFGKKPEIFWRVRLCGVSKKVVSLIQSFPNSVRGWGEVHSPQWGGENQKFYWEDFFAGWREPEDAWFWQFTPFSQLETAFCEYWISITIKMNMTCVSKEHEMEIMEQKQCL